MGPWQGVDEGLWPSQHSPNSVSSRRQAFTPAAADVGYKRAPELAFVLPSMSPVCWMCGGERLRGLQLFIGGTCNSAWQQQAGSPTSSTEPSTEQQVTTLTNLSMHTYARNARMHTREPRIKRATQARNCMCGCFNRNMWMDSHGTWVPNGMTDAG